MLKELVIIGTATVLVPELTVLTGAFIALTGALQVVEEALTYLCAAIDKAEAEKGRLWMERVERERAIEAAKPQEEKREGGGMNI